MAWLQAIIRFFTGGAGGDIIRQIAEARQAKLDAATEQEKIAAQERIDQLELIRKDREGAREHSRAFIASPVLVWPVAFLVWNAGFYLFIVILNAVWFHDDSIQQLPTFAKDWVQAIIYAAVGPVAGGFGASFAVRALRR